MSLILNIDTAVNGASLCLSEGTKILGSKETGEQKETASWLQPAIQQLCAEQDISLSHLSAIAISAGPGSYTGLRVGMASAKGLCFVLNIPLITINTLQMMAAASMPTESWLCPMIDARRMEVFTAIYDNDLQVVHPPLNLILTPQSFHEQLQSHRILFFGNGSEKFRNLIHHPNAEFETVQATANHLPALSYPAFKKGQFANLAYSQPFYGKEFYSPHFKGAG